MRILCLNANTTEYVTQTVAAAMRAALGDTAEVVEATARFGPAIIKTRLDNSVATHGIVDAAVSHHGVDAVMLAVSFDTARDALREVLSVPVIGMSEASVAMARMRGARIGYVSLGSATVALYRETLVHCALDHDMAGWETVEAPSAYSPGDKSDVDAALGTACQRLAAQGADVAILLGAVLAGAAERVQEDSPIPVIDGGAAGALMARAMVELAAPKQTVGSFSTASTSSMQGVSDALVALSSPRTSD
ncbi:MAG: aspartate/glutamate racemase family protein [Pseudomonadota bacterium]